MDAIDFLIRDKELDLYARFGKDATSDMIEWVESDLATRLSYEAALQQITEWGLDDTAEVMDDRPA